MRWMLAAALAAVLPACSPSGPDPAVGLEDTNDSGATVKTERGARAPRTAGDPGTAPGTPTEPGAPRAAAGTRMLEVAVEGEVEWREAREFRSPQGYAIDVLPQVVMTAEEPCCDLAWARADDGFFLRIERLHGDIDMVRLREDMVLALSAVGDAEDVAPGDLPSALRDADLALRARGDDVTLTMAVARVGGARFRITVHVPHREAAEGIVPTFDAMLGSLRLTETGAPSAASQDAR